MKALALISPVWARLTAAGIVRILAYHEVPDAEMFRLQMTHIADRFQPVASSDVINWIGGGGLVSRACWVTFDDGDPTVIENALPVLDELGIPATLFVCPGMIDTDEPYWWQVVESAADLELAIDGETVDAMTVSRMKRMPNELRLERVQALTEAVTNATGKKVSGSHLTSEQLDRWLTSGHDIGNHTWTHPILDTCSVEEQNRQIDLAHDWLSRTVGRVSIFAYPNGNRSHESEQRLVELGYQIALMFDHRVEAGGNPMTTSRVRVNADDPYPEFKAKVAGLHPYVHHRILARG